MKSRTQAIARMKTRKGILLMIGSWLWSGCTIPSVEFAPSSVPGTLSGSAVVQSVGPSATVAAPSSTAHDETISLEKPASFDELKLAALKRLDVTSTTLVTKTDVDHEDARQRSAVPHMNFQSSYCREIKMSLNTLILNTKKLPPLPHPWQWPIVWMAKLVSLPIQVMIPVSAIAFAPITGTSPIWGVETLANCGR